MLVRETVLFALFPVLVASVRGLVSYGVYVARYHLVGAGPQPERVLLWDGVAVTDARVNPLL